MYWFDSVEKICSIHPTNCLCQTSQLESCRINHFKEYLTEGEIGGNPLRWQFLVVFKADLKFVHKCLMLNFISLKIRF